MGKQQRKRPQNTNRPTSVNDTNWDRTSDSKTTVVFETAGNITGVGDVDDIALAGVHMALDLAAHSNDRDHVYGCAAAHNTLNGEAAHAVTTSALLYLVTEIIEELYKATPNLEAFVRPELLKQAIAAGQQRMKAGGHHG